MKMLKRLASVIIAACLVFSVVTFSPFAAADERKDFGDGFSYYYHTDGSTRILEINGSGDMPDYAGYTALPWQAKRSYTD